MAKQRRDRPRPRPGAQYVDDGPTQRSGPPRFEGDAGGSITETVTVPRGRADSEAVLSDDDVVATDRMLPKPSPPAALPTFEATGTITALRDLPPEPPTIRRAMPSVPPPAPPRRDPPPKPRLASVPPPAARPPSLLPPPKPMRPRAPSIPPAPMFAPRELQQPRIPRERRPSPPISVAAHAPPKPRDAARPRLPKAAPASSDATRPFPLQAPQRRPGSPNDPGAIGRFSPTPPPFTVSEPPAVLVAPAHAPVVAPQQPRPTSRPPPPLPSQPPAPPAPLPSEPPPARAPRPAPLWSSPPAAPAPVRADRPALAAAIGVFGALIVSGLIGAMAALSFKPAETPEGEAAPNDTGRPLAAPPTQKISALPPPAAPATPLAELGQCTLAHAAQRLAPAVMAHAVPMVARAPGLDRVAVGFASGRNHAEGVIVDLDDLGVESRFSEELISPVFRVTPLPDRSPVSFAVDTDDPRLSSVRTVPARAQFRIGASSLGVVRLNERSEPSVLWPGTRSDGIGEPVFGTTERDGTVVVFRSPRQVGEILLGWLGSSGTADSDLARIDAGPREVGPPALAVGDKSYVVVFAARGTGERWHLRVASAAMGKVPRFSRELDATAPSGPTDAVFPTIVALPGGGFLVQWVEGTGAERRATARALNARLDPVGLPVELAQGANLQAVPGALVAREDRVLGLHVVAAGRSLELWGSVIRCK